MPVHPPTTTSNPVPIQLPVHRQPAVATQTGRFDQVWYRWTQAMTAFLGNGTGPNVPTNTVLSFMGLRRSP